MLAWLDAHGVAVQAVAAVVSLIVTGVLACLTWTYVRLTRDLSNTARAEAAARAQESDARRARFGNLIIRLQLLLAKLPDVAEPRRLRDATLWSEQDHQGLLELASTISPTIGFLATMAADHMRWLEERVARARVLADSVPPRVVLATDEEWKEHRDGAIRALNDVVAGWPERPIPSGHKVEEVSA